MENEKIREMARKLRFEAVRMVYEGKDGHPGPPCRLPASSRRCSSM